MFDFFRIVYHLFFNKEIYLVNSPLQFINLIEYKYLNETNYKKFKNKKIFLSYPKEKEIKIINYINKNINKDSNEIIIFKNNINIIILLKIIKLRMHISKLNLLILGDYNNYLFQQFYKISKKIVLLDDGTNAFNFNKLFKMNKKNLQIFTIFDKNLFNHNNIIVNNFNYLKSKLNLVKKKNIYIFWVELELKKNSFL